MRRHLEHRPRGFDTHELVLTEDRGPVRHVVLNRPEKRNAFNAELIAALGEALREAAADPDVHVVVLRGNGPMFSSGVDLAELGALAGRPGRPARVPPAVLEAWNLLEEMPKPTSRRSTAAASAARWSPPSPATCARWRPTRSPACRRRASG